MKKVSEYVKKNPMETILTVIMAVQFCLIVCSNFGLIGQNLDGDNAKLMHHIRMMWEEGTPAIPGWNYTTTLEWDCTALFALPLYGLTRNIYFSCALSNVIFLGLFIAAVFYLFRGQRALYPLFCVNLICVPYRIGMLDYYNMLFFAGGQYIVKVMLPILLAGILLALEGRKGSTGKPSAPFYFFSVLYLFLLLLSSMSSGIYVAACGLLPVWIVYFGYRFFRWEKVPSRAVILCAVSILCVVIGLRVNAAAMGGARGNSMNLCGIYQVHSNMTSCFFGLFELMGGLLLDEGIPVFSLRGIGILGKYCLVLLFLVCGAAALARCVKKQGNLRLLLLISIAVWNYFVLNVTYVRAGSTTYEYRYHLIGMIPLICTSAVILLDAFLKTNARQQKCLFLLGAAALLFLHGISFRELFARGEQQAELKDLCRYCAQQDIEVVYLFKESLDADICRLIDGDRGYLCLEDDGTTWAYDNFAIYNPGYMQTENSIVAVWNMEYDMGDSFSIVDSRLVKFDDVAGRSLYYFVTQ